MTSIRKSGALRVLSLMFALVALVSSFSVSTGVFAASKKTPATAYVAVKKAYGKSFPLKSKNRIKNNRRVMGVKVSLCSSYYAASKTVGSDAQKEYIFFIAKAKDSDSKKKIKSALKSYLKNEKSSMDSYLSKTGKKLFKNAKVGTKGKFVYLVVLDTSSNSKAVKAIKDAIG